MSLPTTALDIGLTPIHVQPVENAAETRNQAIQEINQTTDCIDRCFNIFKASMAGWTFGIIATSAGCLLERYKHFHPAVALTVSSLTVDAALAPFQLCYIAQGNEGIKSRAKLIAMIHLAQITSSIVMRCVYNPATPNDIWTSLVVGLPVSAVMTAMSGMLLKV